jgi:hypothetical protein
MSMLVCDKHGETFVERAEYGSVTMLISDKKGLQLHRCFLQLQRPIHSLRKVA